MKHPLLTGLLLPLTAFAASQMVQPVDWLLQQVRVGESVYRDDLVSQSLYRLEKIAPDNPQVIAAQIRLALHQGQQDHARQLLTRLEKVSPDSAITRQAQAGVRLTSAAGRQQLQQARLLVVSGRLAEARAAYDRQFHGVFPATDIALEYWQLVARLPGQQSLALAQLQALDGDAPGSISVRLAIARMQLSRDQRQAAIRQLQQVAAEPAGRRQAAALWLKTIQSEPVTPQTVVALNEYLATFTSDQPQADGLAALAAARKMLADPAYQQRLRGLAMIDRGQSLAAIPALRAALHATPNDPLLLGAMGQAYSRANRRAEAGVWYQRAIAADGQGTDIDKWRSLQRSNLYWLAIAQGDNALAVGDLRRAALHYQQARALDGRDGYALIGLGDVALAQKNPAQAERDYRQAWRMDAANITALRRLVMLYQQQSPQQAMAFINSLPVRQKRMLNDTLVTLNNTLLSAEGDRLAASGNWPQAVATYRQARRATPDDVWLNYRLAGALRQTGERQAADSLMAALARRKPEDASQVYAYALYLSASDRTDEALRQLHRLPPARWDQNLNDLHARLMMEMSLARAERLYAAGDRAAADALLDTLPASTRITLTRADWAMMRGDSERALQGYRAVLAGEPQNTTARLGEIDALLALKQLPQVRQRLVALPPTTVTESVNAGRRVAAAWLAVGDAAHAQALYRRLKPQAEKEMPSAGSALLFRDAARLAASQQPVAAQDDYGRAMLASGISDTLPTNQQVLTRLTRNNPADDWLKRSIRSDAATLARQQDTTLTIAEDYSRSKGTGGISDFTAHTTMMQLETPLAAGKGFVRLDNVSLSAGTFSRNAQGNIDDNFGTCASTDAVCRRDFRQHQNGTSVGLGYNSERWSVDLGTTPLGFEVTNWVGGLTWHGNIQDVGVSVTASRRPVSSSLLAYAGARDPAEASGKRWGGVVATGGEVSLSYDRGEANGLWASLGAHQLTGENVRDNSRQRLMAGYYYKLINEDNRRVTVGLNAMLWHYAHDLSDYSLGQGGYYSPQLYQSLAIPLTYRQRSENWSWSLGGSLSWSQSRSRGEPRYPLSVTSLTGDNPTGSDGSSSGFGYTVQAAVERRLSAHWTLGAGVDLQQAKDYTPSQGLLYVSYSMTGWQGDLDMPVQPLTPYADFN
ncbi:cellulose synthase complex outer membrane protein BcsC [Erwinia mallotivora]|uniref:cellulose synthase complex outer membrane protein BcsC n=1 Tax=Erwinia mallotivora TaxID=69222 RepID=UPI0035EEA58B